MTSGFFHFFNINAQRAQSRASVSMKNRTGRVGAKNNGASAKPRRLLTETLEERQLLAVDVLDAATLCTTAEEADFNVIEIDEISIENIKAAIQTAAQTTKSDLIKIAAGDLKFTSSSDEITIDIDEEAFGSVVIVAQNGELNIDADGLARVFSVKNGSLKLESINISGGKSDYGGAIANGGTLTLVDVELSNNEATVSGGAIANKGTLIVQDSVIDNNTAAVDGAAIYAGDFAWPKVVVPEWSEIPDFSGSKGDTLTIDLTEYCSKGAWTYSFACSDADSAIFAEEPKLENGKLTLKFIGADEYDPEIDYSAVSFDVFASDGKTTAKTSFNVAHESQTSSVLISTFTNTSIANLSKSSETWYVTDPLFDDEEVEFTVYASPTKPTSEVVDLEADNLNVQLWYGDFARAKTSVADEDYEVPESYVGTNVWGEYDKNEYTITALSFYLELDNATLNLKFTDGVCKNPKSGRTACFFEAKVDSLVEDCGETETGSHLYKITYYANDYCDHPGAFAPCGQYELLGALPVTPDGTGDAISAVLTQAGEKKSESTVFRFCDKSKIVSPEGYCFNRVDPSQILFVSAVSDSTEPLSEVPGEPFVTAVATTGALATEPIVMQADSVKYGLFVSNSLIVGNKASGNGVISVADGEAKICNATIADNDVTGAAIYATEGADVEVANTIVVGNDAAPVTSNVEGKNNLVDATAAWSGNVLYDAAKPLFNQGAYSLAIGSQALNIGDDSCAQDFAAANESEEEIVLLKTDLAGDPRFSATVDAGAYEYQGTAPSVPTNVGVSDYVESGKKPVLSWSAPQTVIDGVDGYYVCYGDKQETTTDLSFDVTKLTTLEDNSSYQFSVSAFNVYGKSAAVTVTLNTLVAPTAPTGLKFGEYANGSATLTWTSVSNAEYYQIKDASGSIVADNLKVESYKFTGLADFSTYTYTVVAVNAKGSAASEAITLDTTVAPDTPTGFKVGEKYADNQLTLTWNATEHADGYVVYQKVEGAWQEIETVAGTTLTVTGLNDFTFYEFAVASYANKGAAKLVSDKAELSTYTAVAPTVPTNFKLATKYAGDGTATVQWDEVVNADGYVLAKKTETGAWGVVATTEELSYKLVNLSNNAEYVYGVASYALDDAGNKLISDYVSLTINTITTPAAPTNVKFDAYSGGTSATLKWDFVSDVSGYRVEIQNATGDWELVETTTANSVTVTVAENSKYVYRVAAFNTVGAETRVSSYVEATLDTLVPPTGELNLSVVDYSYSAGTATLTWNALEYASYYVVEGKAGDGDWTTVEQQYEGASYKLKGIQPNVSYSFRVTAANAKGKGVAATTDYFTAAPPAKPGVNYSYDKDAKTATISYSADFADTYLVYEFVGSDWNKVYEGAETSYQATNLIDNESYSFKVVAKNEQGLSEESTITFTASAAPKAPIVAISEYADHSATLTWSSVDFADGYRVYQQSEGAWTQIGSDLGADVVSFVLTGLQDYSNYTFAVVAFNAQGESPYSGVVTLDTTVAPATPSGLAFASEYAGDGKATLTWNAVDNADGYTVKYEFNGEKQEVVVITNRCDVEGLANYANYTFSVSAFAYRGEEKLYSAESDTITLDTTIPPTADLVVETPVYDFTSKTATLSWNAVEHATGYKITLGEVGKSTTTFETTETSYSFKGNDNTNYAYTVVAFNGKGDGSSCSGTFFTAAPPATPNAKFGPYDAENKQATITWSFDENAKGYKLEAYDVTKGAWDEDNPILIEDATITSYTVKGMQDFATYKYRVAAYNDLGSSSWREVSITATTTPAAPTNLKFVYDGTKKEATITWKDDANPSEVSYNVYQWNEKTGGWQFVESCDSLSYTVDSLTNYTAYTYAVTSWMQDETGAILESAPEDAAIEVDTNWTPGNISTAYFVDAEKYDGSGEATLVWNDAEGATLYEIYQYDGGEKIFVDSTTDTAYLFQDLANYVEYTFAIVATNEYQGEGEGGRGNKSEERVVTFSTMIPPSAPLTVEAGEYDFNANTLTLTWNAVDFAVGYKVCLTLDDELVVSATTENTEYTFNNLTDNAEYGFSVVAYNAKGDGSKFDGGFKASAPPKAPTNLAGEYFEATSKATLSWLGDSEAIGYNIQVKNDEGVWEDVYTGEVPTYGGVCSYTVSDLLVDTTYFYRVCAYNDLGASEYAEATLDTSVKSAPKAPSNSKVVYDYDADFAILTWTDNSGNETAFVVQRSYDASNWNDFATLESNVTACELGTPEVGVTYFYRVAAMNVYGYSDWDVVSFTIPTPNAPTDLTFGEYDKITYSVDLSWTDNSDNETGFIVEWSNDQQTWESDTVGANVTTYTKGKLLEGRTYYFRVSAYNKAGVSEYAVGSFDVPTVERKKPEAPSDVNFDVAYKEDFSIDFVTMKWTDNSDDEEKFVVQFSYDQANWYSVKNVEHDVASLNIEGVVEGRTYYFRVAAYNAAGYSDWSEGVLEIKTPEPAKPYDISVSKPESGSVQLSWTGDLVAEKYLVQYSYDGANWLRVGYSEDTTIEFNNVVYGRSYYFRVAAYRGNTTSGWSDALQWAAPSGKPEAPTGLTAEGLGSGVRLTWTDASDNERGFNLEYSVDGGTKWLACSYTDANVTTKEFLNLRAGATYTFRVRSYNSYGRSSWTYLPEGEAFTFVDKNAPKAPSAMTAEYDSDNSVALNWGYEAGEPENVDGYRIQYSYDGGVSWYSSVSTSKGRMESVVSGLIGGRTYSFRVAAYNTDGTSAWVKSGEVVVPVSESAPNAPALSATYNETTKAVELMWNDVQDEKGYKVEYGVVEGAIADIKWDSVKWSDYAYLEAGSTGKSDISGLDVGAQYCFRVAAYNSYGINYSQNVVVTIKDVSGVVAPSIESFSYKPTRRQLTLNWSGDSASYNVQYRYCWFEEDAQGEEYVSRSSWYTLASGTEKNEATLRNVNDGVTYEFRVQAVDENGDLSAWSAVESYDTGSSTSSLDVVLATNGTVFFDELDGDSLDAIASSLL